VGTHVISEAGDPVCEIVIAGGALADPVVPERGSRRRVAVLTQPGAHAVAGLVADRLRRDGLEVGVLELPDRDAAKTMAVVERCYHDLTTLGLTRDDTVVAVGGGAVTDVAGFVAATYLRGVEAVAVPTTLVGAVDAAIGGKTGINVGGKNLVGVFRHPVRVVIDTDLLEALPEELVREGAAEALKAGLIADPYLVELYERDGLVAPMGEVVERAVAVKVRIVSADFRETGPRAWLNYGHTVGHGVEVAGRLSHGDAVAIGMVAEGAVSAALVGFRDEARQRRAILRLGLPAAVSGIHPAEVRRLMRLDKKRTGDGLRMTLLREIGDPVLTHVDSDTVDMALHAIGVV